MKTIDDILAITADRIAAMTSAEANAIYPSVRDGLAEEYQNVGPRARRRHAADMDRLASAARRAEGTRTADSYLGRAASVASQMADDRSAYDRAADVKHLLAIRAGNYDGRLPAVAQAEPGTREGDIQRIAAIRRAELAS